MNMQGYINAEPLFPESARRTTPTLYELSIRAILGQIREICENNVTLIPSHIKKFRKYVRQRLPYHILTELLDRLLPSNRWKHHCVAASNIVHCNVHWECRIIYDRLPLIIELMFSEDISRVNLDLRKVKTTLFKAVLYSFYTVLTKLPRREFPLLTSFVLYGGGIQIDDCITQVEELTDLLRAHAPNLENLRLPVASNIVLSSVGQMGKLRAFRCDRSVKLNRRGIYSLCAKDSKTKYNLEVCHIGVFRHNNFEKQQVTGLVRYMDNLKEFSFLDTQRVLYRSAWSAPTRGDKVFAYSVFKTAIRDHEKKDDRPWPGGRIGPELLATDIREMCVVDRSLKPHYILESAPKLTRLTLDWQEELSVSGEDRYKADWFSEMLRKPSWTRLSRRLTKLDITFPAAHSPNSYGLPLEDHLLLVENLPLVTDLRLTGAGMMAPFPLIPTLAYCPLLEVLVLEKTPIFLPSDPWNFNLKFVHKGLKTFRFMNELSSLLYYEYLTLTIATFMPSLEELQIQPQTVLHYRGLTPKQVRDLSKLERLEKLSVPLSLRDCNSNMPEVVYVLKEFKALRSLVLSWANDNTGLGTSHHISFLTAWLYMALSAENVNMDLQLNVHHHAQEYSSPSHFIC